MNPKTLSDDRTFNVGVKQGKAHFVPDQVLLGRVDCQDRKAGGTVENSTICAEQQTKLCAGGRICP